MAYWQYLLFAGVGALAGFMNVMAGGGSLLTMPAMIFLGFSPAAANGTNRVALLMQSVSAVTSFRGQGFSDFRLSLTLALCTLPGAVTGALAAVHIDPLWFKRLLAGVMIAVLVITLRPSGSGGAQGGGEPSRGRLVLAHIGMGLVGFYGGFIQAGAGFLLMAVLQGMLRLGLVRVNMHKVFVVGVYMVPSLAVFAYLGQVRWIAGLALSVGTVAGAWIATRLQIKRGEGVVRVVFSLAVVAMAIKLLLP